MFIAIVLSLGFATTALADYVPPQDASAPSGSTTTTGVRRGCVDNTAAQLTALAPQKHVGRSADPHPTFAWYVPDSDPFPLEFRLYQLRPNGDRQLIQKAELKSSPGLMAFALPETAKGLSLGQTYIWQVILFCNPNRPSSALVTQAELEVVPAPAQLQGNLSKLDLVERADRYAEVGLWYDALGTVATSKADDKSQSYRKILIDELARLEPTGDVAGLAKVMDPSIQ
jgi:hypothetical protein